MDAQQMKQRLLEDAALFEHFGNYVIKDDLNKRLALRTAQVIREKLKKNA